MMNDYMILVTERLEHEHKMRTLARAKDYTGPVKADQPGWVSRQARRLLHAVGGGMVSLREELPSEQDNLDLTGREDSGTLS
jgi:hypothetical protein